VNDLSQFDDSNDPVYGPPPQTILDTSPYGTYRLLFSDNRLASAPSSTAPLRGPFFYEDNCHTFFVRPRLTEKAISEFTGWAYEDIEPRAKVGPLTPVLAEAPQIEIHGSAIYALQESAALATQGRG
jgi:hypothetical protein